MIIHSPIISGSLTFADGSTFTLPDGGNYSGSFSGSLTGNVNGIDILDVKTDVDAILSGSSADKNSFSEIVTLINSIDTDNDAAFASHYTSSRARLSSLENETGSIGSRVDDLESFSSSLSTDYNDLENVPSGIISSSEQLAADFLDTLGDNVVSSSAQIDLTQTTNYADGIKLKLDAENVFSSSAQVTITESQISDLVHYTDLDVKSKLDTEGVISGSSQLTGDLDSRYVNTNGDNAVTSSAQITLANTTGNLDSSRVVGDIQASSVEYSNILNKPTLFSGSAQVTITESQISDLVHYTDSDVKTKLNAEDVISGSSSEVKSFLSITSSDISDVEAFSQSGNYSGLRAQSTTAGDVGLGNVTNESKSTMFASPTFTGTVSGVSKSHVGLGNVTNESKSTMFSSPAFTGNPTAPTQTSTNDSTRLATTEFVQTRVSELIGNAGSALDTLGELSSSLADDQDALTSLTTTVGNKLAKASNLSDLQSTSTALTNLGLNNVTNESKATMFTSPTFTGTVSGVTKAMVGLGDVENTTLSTYTGQGGALDNQYITNGAGYITSFTNTQLSNEQVQDIVGAMVSSNTESGITVTYQDTDGTIDFEVASQTDNNFTNALKTKLDGIATAAEVNTVDSVAGKAGVVILVKGDVGLGNVDNTSDASKPVSTAQQTALNTKLNINGDNVVSGSSQVSYPNLSNIPSGIISGSSQISISSTNISDVDAFSQSGTYANLRAQATTAGDVGLGNVTNESKTTMFSSPTFTGTVSGVTKSHVGLGNVENTALSTYTGQGGALDNQYITNGAGYITSFTNTNQLTTFQVEDGDGTEVTISHGKEWKFVEGTGIDINWTDTSNGSDGDPYDLTITNTAPFTGDVFDNDGTFASLRAQGTTAGDVGLGNVTNESKATMFASPTFTGTVSGVTKTHVGLGNVDNTSDANKPVSTATQTALNGKLDTTHDFSITLTGDVTGTGTVTNMGNVSFATVVGDDSHNHTIANVDGLQDALDGKQSAGSFVTTDSAQSLSSAANALTLSGNNLILTRGDDSTDTIDLSAYLDEDSRSISSGTLNSVSGVVTFTRDDATTFTLDLSDLLDDTNLVTSVNGRNGVVVTTLADYSITATAAEINKLDGVTATTAEINKLDGVTATTAELNFVDGVTSNIQTQLNNKIESFDITTQTDSKYLRSNTTDTATGVITFSNTTASTSKTTGAVKVTGGVGIGGALNVGGDVVAYASSDKRLKDNIVNIENPIEKVQKLNGVTWDWNGNADELQQSLPNVGVIAQEVEEVFPQLVHDRENGYKGVDYAKLTGLLIEAVKEQQKQIDELKSRLG